MRQLDRRILPALLLNLGLILAFATPASASPGDLDPTFGRFGFAAGVHTSAVPAIAALPDNRVAAVTSSGSRRQTLLELDARGDAVPDFGDNGRTLLPLRFETVDIASSGSHIYLLATDGQATTVSRYTDDGTLDSTYGVGGTATISGGDPLDLAVDIAGRAVVANVGDAPLVRFSAAGNLDVAWNANLEGSITAELFAASVAVDSAGDVLATGWDRAVDDQIAIKVLGNGTVDVSFGQGGAAAPAVEPNGPGSAGIVSTADGEIFVAATVCGPRCGAQLASLTASGAPNPLFMGPVISGGPNVLAGAEGTALTYGGDGAPRGFRALGQTGLVQRTEPTGGLDGEFGLRGRAFLYPDGARSELSDAAVASGGNILVSGQTVGRDPAGFVARLSQSAGRDDLDADGRDDSADKCALVAGVRHRGCRDLGFRKLRIIRRGRQLHGRLIAADRLCSQNVAVVAYAGRGSRKRRIATVRTNSRGSWRMPPRVGFESLVVAPGGIIDAAGFCRRAVRSETR